MIDPAKYTYSRNERNFLIRNEDRVPILEDENYPNNIPYELYLEWLKLGNDPIPLHTISPLLYPSRVAGADFTYSRNDNNVIVRSDGTLIFEHPDDPAYKLYQQWLDDGNEPPAEVPPIPAPPPPYGSIISPTPIKFTYFYNEINILTRSDGVFIPENDPHNPAYKLYLEWLDEGNERPPLNELPDPPEIPTTYKSPYSPHSPTYGPSQLPGSETLPVSADPLSEIASKQYVDEQIAHAIAHALGRSHSH
jgi:hypothetical protein